MTEIFLAYDSGDRERARPVRDALAAQGFDVLVDLLQEQEAPADGEWEGWVRKRLARCKCVVVLQSAASAHSNKMRLVEAVAEEQGKLILVHLEPPRQAQPAGSASGLVLPNWRGDLERPEWRELRRRIEAKLKASLWVQRLIHEVASDRTHWRAQYESSARRSKSLNDELAQERSVRGEAQDKAAGLQAQLEEDAKARGGLETRIADLEQRLAGTKGMHAQAQQQLKEELRKRGVQLADAETALSREQGETVRLRTELLAVESVRCELTSRLTDQDSIIGERAVRIVSLEANLSQLGLDITGLKTNVAERDADIARLKASLAERDASIARLKASVAQRDVDLASLKANVAERDASIAGLKANVAARDTTIVGLKTDLGQRGANIASLTANATERDAYIGELQTGLAQRDTFIADLTDNTAEQDAYIVKLEANLAQRHTYIATLKANIAELEKRAEQAVATRGHELAAPSSQPPQFSMLNRAMLTTLGLAGVALSIVKVRQS